MDEVDALSSADCQGRAKDAAGLVDALQKRKGGGLGVEACPNELGELLSVAVGRLLFHS